MLWKPGKSSGALWSRESMCWTNGTLFQAQLTQEVWKEQTKEAREEMKETARTMEIRKVRAYRRRRGCSWCEGETPEILGATQRIFANASIWCSRGECNKGNARLPWNSSQNQSVSHGDGEVPFIHLRKYFQRATLIKKFYTRCSCILTIKNSPHILKD